jgi:hypothetical protein
MYNINWNKWLDFHLWESLKKVKMKAFLKVLIFPIVRLYNTFLLFRRVRNFELQITPQTRKLRFALNQVFDKFSNSINIVDNADDEVDYIFLSSENKPKYLPDYLNDNAYDFEVQIPFNLKVKEKDIRAFLNIHKLPSKRYIITYF